MGEILKAECHKCRAVWELRLGYGLSHGQDENVINEFPAERKGELEELFKNRRGIFFSFREAICKECHNIIGVPVLSMGSKGEILAVGNCPICGGTDTELCVGKSLPCPRCGDGTVKMQETGQWD